MWGNIFKIITVSGYWNPIPFFIIITYILEVFLSPTVPSRTSFDINLELIWRGLFYFEPPSGKIWIREWTPSKLTSRTQQRSLLLFSAFLYLQTVRVHDISWKRLEKTRKHINLYDSRSTKKKCSHWQLWGELPTVFRSFICSRIFLRLWELHYSIFSSICLSLFSSSFSVLPSLQWRLPNACVGKLVCWDQVIYWARRFLGTADLRGRLSTSLHVWPRPHSREPPVYDARDSIGGYRSDNVDPLRWSTVYIWWSYKHCPVYKLPLIKRQNHPRRSILWRLVFAFFSFSYILISVRILH